MSAAARELLPALAQNIIDADSRDGLINRNNLRVIQSSLENAVRGIVVAQNAPSLISKLPPETIIAISEFVAELRTRESMFEIVKMTHVCQYWRCTLTSCPHLWSSIFVKNDHREFVAACLERSREVPLAVWLDLKYSNDRSYPDCTCIPGDEWSPGLQVDNNNSCRYRTAIDPLLNVIHTKRIRKLDVRLTILDASEERSTQGFNNVLDNLEFAMSPLPSLEKLGFAVEHEFKAAVSLYLPNGLFGWDASPPTRLRHLVIRGCLGAAIRAARNLTSLELTGGVGEDFSPILELTQSSFPLFISSGPSLVSLTLSHCSFLESEKSSRATPVAFPELKNLRLMGIRGLRCLPSLMEVPAFKTLSSPRVSTRNQGLGFYKCIHFQVRAEGDGGFQLFYDTPNEEELSLDWLGLA